MFKSLITTALVISSGANAKSIGNGLFDICYHKDQQRAQVTAVVPDNQQFGISFAHQQTNGDVVHMDAFNNLTNMVHETGYDDLEDKKQIERLAWSSKQLANSSYEFQLLRPLKTYNSDLKFGKPMTIRWHKSGQDSNMKKYLIDRGELEMTLDAENECENKLTFPNSTVDVQQLIAIPPNTPDISNHSIDIPSCQESYNHMVKCTFAPETTFTNRGVVFNYLGTISHQCDVGPFPCPFDSLQILRIFRHGAWQVFLWFFLQFLMWSTTRWYAYLSDKMNYIHSTIGWIIIIGAIWDIADIVIHDGEAFFTYEHRIPAWIIMFAGLFGLGITGTLAFIGRKMIRWDTQTVVKIRRAHRAIAFAIFLCSLPAIFFGFVKYNLAYGKNTNEFAYQKDVVLAAQILIFVFLEMWFQYDQYQEQPWTTLKQTKVFTEEEFDDRIKAGEKLVICDDLVCDIGTYMYAHPGGAFLLEYNIGRDVSKFIFGSFALDQNHNDPKMPNNRWAHSNVARKIVNRHAIGAMIRVNTASGDFKLCHEEINFVNAFTRCFPFKSVNTAHRLPGVNNFYDDLAIMGKHYHIISLQQNDTPYRERLRVVRRHYTISNTMRQRTYNELLRAIDHFNGVPQPDGSEYKFDDEIISDKESNQMNVTLKNYNLKTGMSRRLFDPAFNTETYKMVGPLGKGLGVSAETKGCHFAYSAGTGILVFIDLVARMLLQELGYIPPNYQQIHPDFKLCLYASFKNRTDSMCLPLVEGLQRICMVNGKPDRFKLTIRFSDNREKRWDKKYVFKQMMHHTKTNVGESIQKVWVCGPPLMSEVFDKIFYELSPMFGMHFQSQVDCM